jgi:hypothetical protein
MKTALRKNIQRTHTTRGGSRGESLIVPQDSIRESGKKIAETAVHLLTSCKNTRKRMLAETVGKKKHGICRTTMLSALVNNDSERETLRRRRQRDTKNMITGLR